MSDLMFETDKRMHLWKLVKDLEGNVSSYKYNVSVLGGVFQNYQEIRQQDISEWWEQSERVKADILKLSEEVTKLQNELSNAVKNNLVPFEEPSHMGLQQTYSHNDFLNCSDEYDDLIKEKFDNK